MKISIFGLGYVGCVSLGCLAQKGYEVIGVDVSRIKIDQINSGKATIIEKDIDEIIKEQFNKGMISATEDYKKAITDTNISIISVGTPSSANGHLILESVFNVAECFGEVLKEKKDFHIIAIRSTVIPGTCDKFADIIEVTSNRRKGLDFAVVSNPEFLREGSAVYDYFHPPLTLIGSSNNDAASKLSKLYEDLPAEIIITDTRVSEMMKYVNNSFHALKISFANEIGNICKELRIDSHNVMEIFCKDKQLNISSYYFKPGFAYGGSCLPKDLKALQTLAHDHYVKVPVIDAVDITNELQIKRGIELIESFGKKKLGFLGLSFKAGTDDLRNSPAVTVIETLLGKGYEIRIYDQNIQLSQLTGANKAFIDDRVPHLSKLMVPDVTELINTSDVLVVTTKEQEFVELLRNVNDKTIIDLVLLDEKLIGKENYYGINWVSIISREDQGAFN